MAEQIWTIKKMLDWSRQYFADNHIENPALDAQILLGHVLHMNKVDLIINGMKPMDADELAAYKNVVIQRVKSHTPVAYILGHKEFWSLPLKVSPDVLIPRPDTECIVEHALAFIRAKIDKKPAPWIHADAGNVTYENIDSRQQYYEAVAERESIEQDDTSAETSDADVHDDTDPENSPSPSDSPISIVDVGTGSGAIILALATELTDVSTKLTAIDISPAALSIARENAANLSLGNIDFIESDLLDRFNGTADLIVSNPPYISDDEMKTLAPEVLKEPDLALRAGSRGLDVYNRLIPQAYKKLSQNGALLVEIGCTQSYDVESIFRTNGFGNIVTLRDYAKKPRIVAGIKV